MQNIIHVKKGKLPINFLIMGYIFVLSGIVGAFLHSFILIILFFIGFVIISLEDEIYIDTKNEKIKEFTKILWYFHVGDWKKLKKPQYIALVSVNQTQQIWVSSLGMNQTKIVCKLNFIYKNNKYKNLKSGNKTEMIKLAKEIAKGFKIKIRDLTEENKVWIEF